LFRTIRIAPEAVARIERLAGRGSVAYVMRHRSWVDYLLVTAVLLREGLPAPVFANDLPAVWMRPLRQIAAALWEGFSQMRPRARALRSYEDRKRCEELVAAGQPVLLFMRGRRPRFRLRGRRRSQLAGLHDGRDYIREIVHRAWASGEEVSFIPLAPLRGRGMRRKESRLATLVYSAQEVPSELRRLLSLLKNRHETSISVGAEVGLRDFIRQHQRDGEERVVRRLARSLQIFLYREERVVWGPLLLPVHQIKQLVLDSEEVRETIRRLVESGSHTEAQLRRRASRYLDEMVANFNGVYFSILEFVLNRVWPRLFQGLEYFGLERVIERVKQHPVVLVPCHRSHFDYLILSYVFHLNYVSPPHIAAGINLSFWPLGPLFRGAGAYFIRRTFEGDDLYKAVFRQYLTFLIREGYTQEFFIEGGRSRTGKILTPKLGMLSAIVDAFSRGVRRDLYLVPVSIHYGRVVEEDSYQAELGGREKQPESLRGLLQARRIFRRRHGTVYLTFAEPISLAEALRSGEVGAAGDALQDSDDRRRFVQKLGFRLLREINDASVAGATSVSATVLLGMSQSACRDTVFVERARALVRFLRLRGVRLTASLERNDGAEFRESLAFLENGGLVQRLSGIGGEVIHVPNEKRPPLDFYKNNTIHFFLLAALLVDAQWRGLREAEANRDIAWWLDLFRWEFALPERDEWGGEIESLRAILRAEGVFAADGEVDVAHPFVPTALGLLDNFREAYWAVAQIVAELPEEGVSRKAFFDRVRRQYRNGLLLGELRKPEGISSVTFGNALNRYVEVGGAEVAAGKGREQTVRRASGADALGAILEALARRLALAAEGAISNPPRDD
jgi:glycerol-3-phosphate O-acyltransferase